MANKKDLSEAQGYSRRRLVTAFSGGIPNGMELAPKKNLTPVIVGIGLTVIAILIGIFYGYLKPSLPDDWKNNKLIVAKGSAARYVSLDGTLHPVINTVSARLMIPSDDFEVLTVDDEQLNGIPISYSLGILGAPDSLPDKQYLARGAMYSCTRASNILDNTFQPSSTTSMSGREAIVARVDDEHYYLVTASKRYRLPTDDSLRDEFQRAFGIPQTATVDVPIQWINLFEQGTDIEPIPLVPSHSQPSSQARLEAGTIITLNGNQIQDPTKYLVMEDGAISELNDFTYGLVSVGRSAAQNAPIVVDTASVKLRNSSEQPIPQDWPSTTLTPVASEGKSMCAALPLDGSTAAVQFVTKTDERTSSAESRESALQMHTTFVDAGGALVRASIGSSNAGTIFVIDSAGKAYALTDATEETLKRLGYEAADVCNVPRSWIDVFPTGVELTEEAAGRPVSQDTSENLEGK